MTISSLIFSFCIQLSCLIIFKHRNKPVLAYKEPWMKENGLKKSVQSSLKSHLVVMYFKKLEKWIFLLQIFV